MVRISIELDSIHFKFKQNTFIVYDIPDIVNKQQDTYAFFIPFDFKHNQVQIYTADPRNINNEIELTKDNYNIISLKKQKEYKYIEIKAYLLASKQSILFKRNIKIESIEESKLIRDLSNKEKTKQIIINLYKRSEDQEDLIKCVFPGLKYLSVFKDGIKGIKFLATSENIISPDTIKENAKSYQAQLHTVFSDILKKMKITITDLELTPQELRNQFKVIKLALQNQFQAMLVYLENTNKASVEAMKIIFVKLLTLCDEEIKEQQNTIHNKGIEALKQLFGEIEILTKQNKLSIENFQEDFIKRANSNFAEFLDKFKDKFEQIGSRISENDQTFANQEKMIFIEKILTNMQYYIQNRITVNSLDLFGDNYTRPKLLEAEREWTEKIGVIRKEVIEQWEKFINSLQNPVEGKEEAIEEVKEQFNRVIELKFQIRSLIENVQYIRNELNEVVSSNNFLHNLIDELKLTIKQSKTEKTEWADKLGLINNWFLNLQDTARTWCSKMNDFLATMNPDAPRIDPDKIKE